MYLSGDYGSLHISEWQKLQVIISKGLFSGVAATLLCRVLALEVWIDFVCLYSAR